VENAVWHFLCVAKANGLARAKELLINIQEDSRIPMMQIYALYAGKGSREDVLKAAQGGNPNPSQLKGRLFYAHLYLGLYEEAVGNEKASLEHIRKAVQDYPQEHYMGDVARVHLKLREAKK
jgi:lipoprotein NlpI